MERQAGLTLWRYIYNALTEEIESGELPPGSKLPSESELSQRFSVNRHTVRRALSTMAEEGLIRVEQGRGSFVEEHILDYLIGARTRFSEIVGSQARSLVGRVLSSEVIDAGPELARHLGIEDGAACYRINTLRQADDRPITFGSHHFPCARFPDLPDKLKGELSISQALASFGCADYRRRTTRVIARLPDASEAAALEQPRSRPILVTESINVDKADIPIEFGIARFAADRVQITFES